MKALQRVISFSCIVFCILIINIPNKTTTKKHGVAKGWKMRQRERANER